MMMIETRVPGRALYPLFLIAFAAVGVEIALTRFFAVASWSEYGYWVISIAMTGFAASGVVMVLGRETFLRHAPWLLPALPLAMLPAGAIGWIAVTLNGFNPLALQNPETAGEEFMGILGYYAALFPFFFLAGFAVSLNFVVHARDVGRVYGYDLLGAGLGAALALGLMWLLHPFLLIPALLPALALAAALTPSRRPLPLAIAAVSLAAACLAAVFAFARPTVSEYKPIYAPLNVPDSRVLAEFRSPRGLYQLLDNFTERLDTDVSNNAGTLGTPAPPRSFGLYRDGSRIAALPMRAPETGHARAALDGGPYALLRQPRVLSLGGSGGFRAAEALALGAAHVTVIEPEPVLRHALRHGLGPSPAMPADPRVTLGETHPLNVTGRFDLVDIAGDFLGADDQNRHAHTVEALAFWLGLLEAGGMVSIPISIRELPVYAVRVLVTAREALRHAGMADPAAHIAVYRSAWNVRVLIARDAFTPERIAALQRFCDARSFDLSYAPGIDALAAGRTVWNELTPVSLDPRDDTAAGSITDAIAAEAALIMGGTAPPDAFDRTPITADRPWLSPVVRLGALDLALTRVEVLPQPEISLLVNVAVLIQAVVMALIVSALPLVSRRSFGVRAGLLGRALIYFPALGLGFLFVEIALIEHASLLLGDRISGFALVLTAMLIFSGFGAMLAGRFAAAPRRGLMIVVGVVVLWTLLALIGLRPALLALLDWPVALRVVAVLAAVAPLALAMGLAFPIGLDRFQAEGAGLLPWAWALNGAFSVIATPLANLIAHGWGLTALLLLGVLCYVATVPSLPGRIR